MSDPNYHSALHWSHQHNSKPPAKSGVNWLWVVLIIILLLIAGWWWWVNYGRTPEKESTNESKLFQSMREGASGQGTDRLIVTPDGRVQAR